MTDLTRIVVVGAGHAGLVTAAGLSEMGHDVTCLDIDRSLVESLRRGIVPFYEPELAEMIARGTTARRLAILHTSEGGEAVARARVVFVVVGTPRRPDGSVDLAQPVAVLDALGARLADGVLLVIKSTVPVGTTRELGAQLGKARPELTFGIAANPEFLRQGSAIADFLTPDRVVVGVDGPASQRVIEDVYRPLTDRGVRLLVTSVESAELIKYASNAFLATKLSFINEMADLCEASGASIDEVIAGLSLDPRIGSASMRPGPGFGGACLPKDSHALLHTSQHFGTGSRIVGAALAVNEGRLSLMVSKIEGAVGTLPGKTVAVLGVTFKASTDDIRESPAMGIITALNESGARVRVFDPRGMERAAALLPESVEFSGNAYDAMTGADAVVVATEWPEFGTLDLAAVHDLLARPVMIDLRNLYSPDVVASAGLTYVSIGRDTH